MTRTLDRGLAVVALTLFIAVCTWVLPAKADSVPASFDCAKAQSVVEKFICAQAVLRWQDLALSRSYAAAKAAVGGAARDDLVLGQRDWVSERDRRCIGDRTFEELSDPATALQNQAYDCLNTVYLNRRLSLQDLALPPVTPLSIEEIDLQPIAAARPEISETGQPRVSRIEASPDGSMLAILLPSAEFDFPDQLWLYRVADHQLVAATPPPRLAPPPHPDDTVVAILSLDWQGDTLYARVAIANSEGEGEEGTTDVYAATFDGSNRLEEVPNDIYLLLEQARSQGVVGQGEVPESDWDILDDMRSNPNFIVWAYDLGHGTIELRVRQRVSGSPVYLAAWGSWGLWHYLFDSDRSQLVYAADTGISVFDMATHAEQRIAGTSSGDQPHALSADQSLFIWSTRNTCGAESLAEQDESQPERFCLAHLPKKGASP